MNRIIELSSILNWKFWLGLFVSALFVYLALRGSDLAGIWTVIQSTDLWLLSLSILMLIFQYLIRTWRWYVFLEPIKRTSFSNRFLSILIGFAANCVLPVRLGEFIRANYLGHTERISRSSAFGTVVTERIFDGLTLLLVLVIALLTTHFSVESLSPSGISLYTVGFFLFFVYALLITSLIGFKYRTELFLKLFNKIFFFLSSRLKSKLIDVIRDFSLGLLPAESIQGWVLSVFYSFLLWATSLYQIYLVAGSIDLKIPFTATFLILAMASFGVMIPSAPGFIGTFHFWVKYGFLLYGAGKDEALSAAILFHGIFFFPTIIIGFIAFLILHFSMGTISGDPNQSSFINRP
jgi:uncharacterized protein (TIRG00374 family)